MSQHKIHRTQLTALHAALSAVFIQGIQPERALQSVLRAERRFGSRDRAFVASSFFEMIRWWRKCWNGLDEQWDGDPEKLQKVILDFLAHHSSAEERDWKILQSVSEECFNLGCTELGENKWKMELEAMNVQAPVFLRVNTLKSNIENVLKVLHGDGVEATWRGQDSIQLLQRKKLDQSPVIKNGLAEVQDISSQQVAPYLEVRPGEKVLDLCAGAGGKTLHLAALMNDQGKIIATDAASARLTILKERANKAGTTIIESLPLEKVSAMKDFFDKILIDAPCSGSGVIRREPIKKYRLTVKGMGEFHALQSSILDRASALLKPGGVMVYATCSLFPSENRTQVDNFLLSHPNHHFLDEKQFYPSESDGDGFYMARIKKNS